MCWTQGWAFTPQGSSWERDRVYANKSVPTAVGAMKENKSEGGGNDGLCTISDRLTRKSLWWRPIWGDCIYWVIKLWLYWEQELTKTWGRRSLDFWRFSMFWKSVYQTQASQERWSRWSWSPIKWGLCDVIKTQPVVCKKSGAVGTWGKKSWAAYKGIGTILASIWRTDGEGKKEEAGKKSLLFLSQEQPKAT